MDRDVAIDLIVVGFPGKKLFGLGNSARLFCVAIAEGGTLTTVFDYGSSSNWELSNRLEEIGSWA